MQLSPIVVMKRNFSNESAVNSAFRAVRALSGRLRGRVFSALGMFHPESSPRIYFGGKPRFINSRSIKFGERCAFGVLARLECHGEHSNNAVITFGAQTSFGDYLHIGATQGVFIGNNVLGGSGILIVDHSHGNPAVDAASKNEIPPRYRPLTSKGKIIIGDHVWIGDGARVLAGTTIGEGAIIAAGARVSGNVEPYSIYFGKGVE